jgi:hypothetical protein
MREAAWPINQQPKRSSGAFLVTMLSRSTAGRAFLPERH